MSVHATRERIEIKHLTCANWRHLENPCVVSLHLSKLGYFLAITITLSPPPASRLFFLATALKSLVTNVVLQPTQKPTLVWRVRQRDGVSHSVWVRVTERGTYITYLPQILRKRSAPSHVFSFIVSGSTLTSHVHTLHAQMYPLQHAVKTCVASFYLASGVRTAYSFCFMCSIKALIADRNSDT